MNKGRNNEEEEKPQPTQREEKGIKIQVANE